MSRQAARPLRLLLVDDDAQWRTAARALLAHQGAGQVVGEAADAQAVVALAERLRPDVVLLDLHLPGIDGHEATRKLRAARPATRVLVLTSSDADADVEEAFASGATGYALKTDVVGCLGDAVRDVAAGRVVRPQARSSPAVPAPPRRPPATAGAECSRAVEPVARGRSTATIATGAVLAASLVAGAAVAGLSTGAAGRLGLPWLRSAELALQRLDQALPPLDASYVEAVLGTRFPGTAGPAGGPARTGPAQEVDRATPRGPATGAAPARAGERSDELHLRGVPNDDRRDAVEVQDLPTTVRLDDRAATREPDEPTACSATGGTTWYAYWAASPTTLLVDTVGSDHATAVGVFTGAPHRDAQPAGCGTDVGGRATTTVPLAAGQRALVQVASPLGGGGLVVRLSAVGTTSMLAPPGSRGENGENVVVSGDGNVVAWEAYLDQGDDERRANCRGPAPVGDYCYRQVLVHDRRTGVTEVVTPTTSGSARRLGGRNPSLSYDGSLVGFVGAASWVVGDDDGTSDYYVADRRTGQMRLASVSSTGARGTALPYTHQVRGMWGEISSDGRYAVFASHADGLVPDDRDGRPDVFRHDLHTGRTELISRIPKNDSYTFPHVSADGRSVLFLAYDDGGVTYQGFLWEEGRGIRQPLRTHDGRVADQISRMDLSADGRWAAWVSSSPDVVPDDTNGLSDAFLTDLRTGRTRRVSVASDGTQASGGSQSRTDVFQLSTTGRYVAVNADGTRVAFDSPAPNLVAGDSNGSVDVFVHEVRSRTTRRVSVTSEGREGRGTSVKSALSHDGRVIVFQSSAALDPRDDDELPAVDAYLHDERGGS